MSQIDHAAAAREALALRALARRPASEMAFHARRAQVHAILVGKQPDDPNYIAALEELEAAEHAQKLGGFQGMPIERAIAYALLAR